MIRGGLQPPEAVLPCGGGLLAAADWLPGAPGASDWAGELGLSAFSVLDSCPKHRFLSYCALEAAKVSSSTRKLMAYKELGVGLSQTNHSGKSDPEPAVGPP